MSLEKSTEELGISLNQARCFPKKFNSWLGAMVLSIDNPFMTLGGQGFELRVRIPGFRLFIGDKVLVKISKDNFKKWLSDSHYVIHDIMDLKVLSSQPSPPSPSPPTPPVSTLHHHKRIEVWNDFLDTVRRHFKNKGFSETPTPYLVPCPGFESTIEPFATLLSLGKSQKKLFLPTSPELHLKKLLSHGWSEIFEIKQSFRNGELSPHHQPEFTLLEWYRAYDSLHSLSEDIKDLLCELDEKQFITGSLEPFQKHSISQLFLKFTGLELTPSTRREELVEYCHHISQPVHERDTWDDVFHLIFVSQIESHLGKTGPEFVYNFPASQASLSQINKEGWAERFELYWRGFEIGNAFNELLDPVEHRKRFNTEIALREKKGSATIPMDEDFMVALNTGLPPCAGIAVGLERLFLACQNMDSLKELRLFPFRL